MAMKRVKFGQEHWVHPYPFFKIWFFPWNMILFWTKTFWFFCPSLEFSIIHIAIMLSASFWYQISESPTLVNKDQLFWKFSKVILEKKMWYVHFFTLCSIVGHGLGLHFTAAANTIFVLIFHLKLHQIKAECFHYASKYKAANFQTVHFFHALVYSWIFLTIS